MNFGWVSIPSWDIEGELVVFEKLIVNVPFFLSLCLYSFFSVCCCVLFAPSRYNLACRVPSIERLECH